MLASRPYHNDPLVNHDLPKMLSDMGHSVLPPDAVPGIADVDLSASRIDIVNNFHQRMLASAVIAADSSALEYVQLVSFGCGHDAYLSDEICRLMKERSGKQPLILKLDESDVAGPLRIRVRSFIETVDERRARQAAIECAASESAIGAPKGSAFVRPSAPTDAHPAARPLPRQVRQSRSAHQDHPRAQHLARVLPAHVGVVRPPGRTGRLS